MTQYPKNKPYRNEKYLNFIRDKECVVCGTPFVVPHHIRRLYWGAGTGIKPHDYVTLPLCFRHHDPAIEKEILIERKIIDFLMQYIEKMKRKP